MNVVAIRAGVTKVNQQRIPFTQTMSVRLPVSLYTSSWLRAVECTTKSTALPSSRSRIPSGDYVRLSPRFVRVSGDGLVGGKVPITLDGEAKLAADGGKFVQTHVSKFRAS